MPTTGHSISGAIGQGFGRMMNLGISAEIIYSFVIIVCSLMIFFGTKEFYRLSNHKGIKYFRRAFLFFALAYFFRSFIKIILFYFEAAELRTILPIFGSVTLFIFMYFGSMAIFYLLFSVMYKKWNNKLRVYIFHAVSLIMATLVIIYRNPTTYLLINSLLFIFVSSTVYNYSRLKKKSSNLFVIYFLLFIFWIFNILDVLIPNIFKTFQLLIYLTSLGIFMTILYKVIRKTG